MKVLNRTHFDSIYGERVRHRDVHVQDGDLAIALNFASDGTGEDCDVHIPEGLAPDQLVRLPALLEAAVAEARRLRWLED